jgi:hypothetical protein
VKCARCGRQLVEGDEAVEVDVRRIVVEGTRVEFINDVDVYCAPCHDGTEVGQ